MVLRRSGLYIYYDTLTPGVQKLDDEINNRIDALLQFFAPNVESYMRVNAPWTDRTGNARNGLRAEPSTFGSNKGIDLSHSVPYGIWLEVRFEGRYAIIEPTIQAKGPELMSLAKRILSG